VNDAHRQVTAIVDAPEGQRRRRPFGEDVDARRRLDAQAGAGRVGRRVGRQRPRADSEGRHHAALAGAALQTGRGRAATGRRAGQTHGERRMTSDPSWRDAVRLAPRPTRATPLDVDKVVV